MYSFISKLVGAFLILNCLNMSIAEAENIPDHIFKAWADLESRFNNTEFQADFMLAYLNQKDSNPLKQKIIANRTGAFRRLISKSYLDNTSQAGQTVFVLNPGGDFTVRKKPGSDKYTVDAIGGLGMPTSSGFLTFGGRLFDFAHKLQNLDNRELIQDPVFKLKNFTTMDDGKVSIVFDMGKEQVFHCRVICDPAQGYRIILNEMRMKDNTLVSRNTMDYDNSGMPKRFVSEDGSQRITVDVTSWGKSDLQPKDFQMAAYGIVGSDRPIDEKPSNTRLLAVILCFVTIGLIAFYRIKN